MLWPAASSKKATVVFKVPLALSVICHCSFQELESISSPFDLELSFSEFAGAECMKTMVHMVQVSYISFNGFFLLPSLKTWATISKIHTPWCQQARKILQRKQMSKDFQLLKWLRTLLLCLLSTGARCEGISQHGDHNTSHHLMVTSEKPWTAIALPNCFWIFDPWKLLEIINGFPILSHQVLKGYTIISNQNNSFFWKIAISLSPCIPLWNNCVFISYYLWFWF